jgi:hypothetical protein
LRYCASAVLAGDEQLAAGQRRLRARGADAGVTEGPLQFQARQVGGGEPAGLLVLVARRGRAIAVAIPARAPGRIPGGALEPALVEHLGRAHGGGRQALAAGELGDGALLRIVQQRTLQLHLAVGQRGEDGLGAELLQLAARRRLLVRAAGRGGRRGMAQGALGGEDQLVLGTLGGERGAAGQDGGQGQQAEEARAHGDSPC